METNTILTRASLNQWFCRALLAAALGMYCIYTYACDPYVTAVEGNGARLRTHTTDLIECSIDEANYEALLKDWQPDQTQLEWLFLGRLVDYPWLVDMAVKTALEDDGWNRRLGRPRSGHDNSYFAALLERATIRSRIEAPLRHHGFYVRSISVEKVLKAPANTVVDHLETDDIVPFDAQVWLNLGRSEK